MKVKNFYKTLLIIFLAVGFSLSGCKKDDESKKDENPFIGSWKETAYTDGSYELINFRSDKSFQWQFYDGEYGNSEVKRGVYDYSASTSTIILKTEDGDSETLDYDFLDFNTLILDGYTYFKQ